MVLNEQNRISVNCITIRFKLAGDVGASPAYFFKLVYLT